MTIIYVTEYNTKCYGVTLQNNGLVKVQELEDVHDDENIIFEVNPVKTFWVKVNYVKWQNFRELEIKKYLMEILFYLKIGKENNKHKYVYIGGDMVCSFLTNDRIYKYISNMCNNLTPCSIAIGWENIYYLTPYFRIIKKENIDVDDIDKLFDIDYDDITSREKIEINKIHSNYDHVSTDDEDDE